MAKLLNNDLTYVSFPIVKVDKTEDGDILVWGKATDGSVDSDQQIVDPEWSGKALEKWLSTGGNVRVMHSAQHLPAGKGVELDKAADGHWVRSMVVEPTAKRLVDKGVLQAYSVGISNPLIVRDSVAKGGRIVGGEIHELSLVDRPANKNCGITLVKSASGGDPEEVTEWFGDIDELLGGQVAKGARGECEPDGGEDGGEPDARKAYDAARAEWLAREPKASTAASAPENGTVFLAKRAARDAWERWDAEGGEEGFTDPDEGFTRWAEKRDFDPGTGGGVDRDKLPASDFGDPAGRKFPIVTPSDVSDAAHLIGHADNPDAVRDRITSIAHRKGPEFEAELPDGWSGKAAASHEQVNLFHNEGDMPAAESTKSAKKCPSCGADHHADSKLRRCENCGAKLPKAKDTMGKSDSRPLPADTRPAGQHREPDGDEVERLEHDAGMRTDPDPEHDKVPPSVKGKKGKPFPGAAKPFGHEDDGDGDEDDKDDSADKAATPVSYALKRMHDATCAAYHWDDVVDEYPALKGVGDALDTEYFQDRVIAAATKGDMASAFVVSGLAQVAGDIAKGGGYEPAMLADARAHLHKSFADMYPNTQVHPGSVTPGQFQRPYISAGHAPLSASGGRPTYVPPASHVPDPNDFDRGLITAGHEADSPRNKGDNLDTPNVSSGASRTYYRNASRDAARNAMQSMHDHIAGTFPDMCPMAASKSVMPPDMGDANRPHTVQPMETGRAPGEKAATAEVTSEQGPSKKTLAKLFKAAVAEARADLETTYELKIADLQAEIDRLGAQPDPAQAPLRGVVRKAATTDDTEPQPAEKVSLVEKAQQQAATERTEYVAYLTRLAGIGNPNVSQRESAARELNRLLNTP